MTIKIPLRIGAKFPGPVRDDDLIFASRYRDSGLGFLLQIARLQQAVTGYRPVVQIRSYDESSTFFHGDTEFLVSSAERDPKGVALYRFCVRRSSDLLEALLALATPGDPNDETAERAIDAAVGQVLPHVHLDGVSAAGALAGRLPTPSARRYQTARRHLADLYGSIGTDARLSYSGFLQFLRDVSRGSDALKANAGDDAFIAELKDLARRVPPRRARRLLTLARSTFNDIELSHCWPAGPEEAPA